MNEEQPGSVKGTGTYEITGVKYNGQEVTETLKVPDDGEITLQVETDTVSEDSTFYGFVQGKYYEILLENSEITFGEEKTLAEIETGAVIASELTATFVKESGATTNVDILVDQSQKEVTIKGKGVNTGRGAETVKISYGNTRNIGIDVVETFTVTVQAEQENNIAKGTITSPSVATQKYARGSKIILQATPNEGLKLKDWYDGTTAIGTTNQYEYTVNGNKTITARFDEKFALGSEVRIGNERFHIIKRDISTHKLTLIAKYNLKTVPNATTGKYEQDGTVNYGDTACAFSSTNYWSLNWVEGTRINLNIYETTYNITIPASETNLNNAVLKARKYAADLGISATGRLLTYEEADISDTANCLFNSLDLQTILYGRYTDDDKVGGLSGNGYLSYWLASSDERDNISVWRLKGNYRTLNGSLELRDPSFNNSGYDGVRPVIEVLESAIE